MNVVFSYHGVEPAGLSQASPANSGVTSSAPPPQFVAASVMGAFPATSSLSV